MHRNILVPFNGSKTAALGVRAAVRLAKAHGSRIRLIHVLGSAPFIGPGVRATRIENVIEEVARAHRAALRWSVLEVQNEGIEAEGRVIEAIGAHIGETIVAEARAWPAQLIVCGTRGRHGVARLFRESHAELIVRRSPIPVLLIPADGRSEPELARLVRRPKAAPEGLTAFTPAAGATERHGARPLFVPASDAAIAAGTALAAREPAVRAASAPPSAHHG